MIIPIIYVFDEQYAEATIVSAISVLQNNKEKLEFHLIYPSRMDDPKNVVEQEILSQGGEVIKHPFLDESVPKYKISFLPIRGEKGFQPWKNTIFMKLKIHEIVERDKVIFIDGDTLVGNCLNTLFHLELEDKIMAAVPDNLSNNTSKYWQDKGAHLSHYFNTGVMLLDLKKLREFNFSEKCELASIKFGKFCQYADQDLYNIVLNREVNILLPDFNIQAWWGNTDKRWKQQLSSCKKGILHFVGNVKPWHLWHRPNVIKHWKSFSDQAKTLDINFTNIETIEQAIYYSRCLDLEEKYLQASDLKTKIIQKLLVVRANEIPFSLDNHS